MPLYSLYSDTRELTAEMLQDVDVLVVDLQDIGTRIYTYMYTMANCMRAARRHGKRSSCAIRRTSIGGIEVEGITPNRAMNRLLASIRFRPGTA